MISNAQSARGRAEPLPPAAREQSRRLVSRGATRRSRRARAAGKPIFLSIGYATCHWCHVMERESFENAGVAEVLNDLFVSIKVDREERPDVDRVYMTFVQATTGSGGWPMSVWLTPELQPFYGGTYFPPTAQWGRPAFVDVLRGDRPRLARGSRCSVVKSAAEIVERLAADGARAGRSRATPGDDGAGQDAAAVSAVASTRRRGGFGDAPKFPRPSELLFLLREHARTGNDAARDMVLQTLRAMALGGMRDHIGGGFHRYSVDGDWRVPHFEKMLYDQAQLVLAYLEAAQAGGDPFFAQIAEDTLQYVRRDMTDAARRLLFGRGRRQRAARAGRRDPHAHKIEGAFYVWTADEIRRAARRRQPRLRAALRRPAERQRAVRSAARVRQQEPALHGAVDRRHRARARARRRSTSPRRCCGRGSVLFDARELRPRPQLDDKVLTAWNGLMIAAFARASRVLGRRRARAGALASDPARAHLAARDARRVVHPRRRCGTPSGGVLLRRYRAGRRGDRRLRRGLRLPDLRPARAVPGRRRSGLAGVGARAAGAAGRAVLGRRRAAAGSAPPARIRRCWCG